VLDPAAVDRSLRLPPEWIARQRALWLELASIAIFGDLRLPEVGAAPRLRKRVLDAGERLRALAADRSWIPQPRERLKSALACALGAREALDQIAAAATELDGPDRQRFAATCAALRAALVDEVTPRANEWAKLLDRRPPRTENSAGRDSR
jgi:hypothetical protein